MTSLHDRASRQAKSALNRPSPINKRLVQSKTFAAVLMSLEASGYVQRTVTYDAQHRVHHGRYTITTKGRSALSANSSISLPLIGDTALVFMDPAKVTGTASRTGGAAAAAAAPRSAPRAVAALPLHSPSEAVPHSTAASPLTPGEHSPGADGWLLHNTVSECDALNMIAEHQVLQTAWRQVPSGNRARVGHTERLYGCTMCSCFSRNGVQLSCTAKLRAVTDISSSAKTTRLYVKGSHVVTQSSDELVHTSGSGLPPPMRPDIEELIRSAAAGQGPKSLFISYRAALEQSSAPRAEVLCVFLCCLHLKAHFLLGTGT